MLVLGPVIFGFIVGFIVGTRLKTNPESNSKFTISSFVVIFIVAIIMAWQLGQFPYYDDLPTATGFVSGAVGLGVRKILLSEEKLKINIY